MAKFKFTIEEYDERMRKILHPELTSKPQAPSVDRLRQIASRLKGGLPKIPRLGGR